MNLKKRLRHLANLNNIDRNKNAEDTKRVSIIHAAKDNGGLYITTSIHEARHLERHFGFSVRSYDVNLDGYAGPFYFDPNVIEDLFLKAANKIELLEKQLKDLQTPSFNSTSNVEDLQHESND